MQNLPYQPLLLSLLASMGAVGCGPDHEKDVSYIAGELQPLGDHEERMPALPCLPKSDARLRGFNPSCDNDFAITAGPTQATNADGKDICVYHIEYDVNDNCAVGRPLMNDALPVLAPLRATAAWS